MTGEEKNLALDAGAVLEVRNITGWRSLRGWRTPPAVLVGPRGDVVAVSTGEADHLCREWLCDPGLVVRCGRLAARRRTYTLLWAARRGSAEARAPWVPGRGVVPPARAELADA